MLDKIIKREEFMGKPGNHLLDLQRDYEIILSAVEELLIRADRNMAVAMAVMSIEESKKAVEQNRSLTRLTWLAVIFVPLSFTASLFSMNADLLKLKHTLGIFFAVAVSLTELVLFVIRYAYVGFDVEWKQLFRKVWGSSERQGVKWE